MAEALRRGEDLHTALAADLMGISYEECAARIAAGDRLAEEMRQISKPANFGFPGGMAGPSFVSYAAGYGIVIEASKGKQMHTDWMKKWSPDMERYFRHISSITRNSEGVIEQLYSGRVRGGLRYTQACNSFFQGLAADGAKAALWAVMKECYLGKKFGGEDEGEPSPLAGCRPIIFMHDEIITEVRNDWRRPDLASNAAKRQQHLMIREMSRFVPDIPIKASPVVTVRWHKGAKGVLDKAGNYLPSQPAAYCPTCKIYLDDPDTKKCACGTKTQTKWVADLPEGVCAADS
jgi:DNA polymerase I-like protein with 3'-5' exonuclease and polymerase domains